MQVEIKKRKYPVRQGIVFRFPKNPILNFEGGVVDKERLNSFYFVISSHIELGIEKPISQLKRFNFGIKQNVNKFISNKDCILPNNCCVLDYPESIVDTKKGFFKLEYTFFNKGMDRKEIYNFLSELSGEVIEGLSLEPEVRLTNKRSSIKRI